MKDICPSRDDAQSHLYEDGRCVLCRAPSPLEEQFERWWAKRKVTHRLRGVHKKPYRRLWTAIHTRNVFKEPNR